VYSSNLESRGTAKNAWMDVTLNILEGRLRVTALKLLDGTSQSINASDEVIAEIIETVNAEHEIKAYLQSEGYFAVRIKHFGDSYTPWTTPLGADGKPITTNTTVDSYAANGTNIVEQDQKNFLGRYGVVRNNWYVINIDAINSYGEPTAADLPLNTTPDDKSELEEAIACRINILSWAKRVQSEEL
ncbi:MAG: Mfa1 fimbrilin C-terminal domain-containing protein, partial [Muribaculaceae bacterium]|nr:Mfa1 fimbrilin C-terminal domain-containing protein [Muribaculaceae bacterium]